jgi:hypothetical protein
MANNSSAKNSGWRKNNLSPADDYQLKEGGGTVYLVNQLGEPFEVNAEGSLLLLSLGEMGLRAWRRAKALKAEID